MLLLYLCRRRKKRQTGPADEMEAKDDFSQPGRDDGHQPTDSPTPLLPRDRAGRQDSSGHAELPIPPLRLRDRKLLPSFLKPLTRPGSPPLTPLTPNPLFPCSPLCTPTTSRLAPRNEAGLRGSYQNNNNNNSTTTTSSKNKNHNNNHNHHNNNHGSNATPRSPPEAMVSFMPGLAITTTCSDSGKGGRSSMGSYAASSTTARSSVRNDVTTPSATSGTPLRASAPTSPERPPRPHEGPLYIPGLLRPAHFSAVASSRNGSSTSLAPPPRPPPQRALPPPPVAPPRGCAGRARSTSTSTRFSTSNSNGNGNGTAAGVGMGLGVAVSTPSPSTRPPPPPGMMMTTTTTKPATRPTMTTTTTTAKQQQAKDDVMLNDDGVSLTELTEEYAREARDSWSSWFGPEVGGGVGPGIGSPAGRGVRAPGSKGAAGSRAGDGGVREGREGGGQGGNGAGPPAVLDERELATLGGVY
jgi:hypothetical protein